MRIVHLSASVSIRYNLARQRMLCEFTALFSVGLCDFSVSSRLNFLNRRSGVKRKEKFFMRQNARKRVRMCLNQSRVRLNAGRSALMRRVQVSMVLKNRSETSHFYSALFEPMQINSTESVLFSRATQIEDHLERCGRVKGTLISERQKGKSTFCSFRWGTFKQCVKNSHIRLAL